MSKIMLNSWIFLGLLLVKGCCASTIDLVVDEKVESIHKISSLDLLLFVFLLILTVLTSWLFKHHRISFAHESGLAIIYGLIIGALIRYAFVNKDMHARAMYKATFDPEIFFDMILPPIIFYAGYSLNCDYFFHNIGAVLTYAIVGTTISSFVTGILMYYIVQITSLGEQISFSILDMLYFGALISSTDTLAILSVFQEVNVDANLYAMVFGESVLNDAVSIGISGSLQYYGLHSESDHLEFQFMLLLKAVGNFIRIFVVSLLIGVAVSVATALLTKFTKIRKFPLLETALFVLMSYSTFILAEFAELTGIVAVLFCGIWQAHYTYNNLSEDSRARTQHLFELFNFLAENFIFCYVGVSMFTFSKHLFNYIFIIAGFLCTYIGRILSIYPLSFLLNLNRKDKIPFNFQHMMLFAGLRGAMSFALAIRNTVSEARQAILTTTSLIVIVTVIVQGGATSHLIRWFKIPIEKQDDRERSLENLENPMLNPWNVRSEHNDEVNKNGRLLLAWNKIDTLYIKPLLTNSSPTLIDTLPRGYYRLAKWLTTKEQMEEDRIRKLLEDSGSVNHRY